MVLAITNRSSGHVCLHCIGDIQANARWKSWNKMLVGIQNIYLCFISQAFISWKILVTLLAKWGLRQNIIKSRRNTTKDVVRTSLAKNVLKASTLIISSTEFVLVCTSLPYFFFNLYIFFFKRALYN